MSGTAVRFLVLGVQDWPLVAAGVPPREPAVVLRGNRVRVASAAARAEGVRPGLRRRDAQARCPEVRIVADDPPRDVRTFEPVVAAVADLCPQLAIFRPGWCGFPTRGPSRYFGGDEALAVRVQQVVRDALSDLGDLISPSSPSSPDDLGGTEGRGPEGSPTSSTDRARPLPTGAATGATDALVRVGVADGRFTAELAASVSGTGPPIRGRNRLSADQKRHQFDREPVGDDPPTPVGQAGPTGPPASTGPVTPTGQDIPPPLVVPPGGSARWLAPLPVAVLARQPGESEGPVPADLVDLLRRLGLTTLGAVAEVPAGDLVARFGPDGSLAHRLASGLDDQPARLLRLPEDLAVESGFDPPLDRIDQLAFAVRPLAEELHQILEHQGETCTRLVVVAETDHGERRERGWRHGTSMTADTMAERIRWQLDSWLQGPAADRPTAGIALLRLVAEEVVASTGTQLTLWDSAALPSDRVLRAVARLARLLGPDAVRVPRWRGGRHPADQVALVPAETVDLAGPRPDDALPPTGPRDPDRPPWPGRLPVPSPTAVLADADRIPVEVLDTTGTPVTVSGRAEISAPPAQLVFGGGGGNPRRPGHPGPGARQRSQNPPQPQQPQPPQTPPPPSSQRIVGWAGPWPITERWWESARRRRLARFQVTTEDGSAYLLVLDRGRWLLAAIYD